MITKYERRKQNTAARNAAIQRRFDELYNIQRLRYDDVLHRLANEFYISPEVAARVVASVK